MDAVRFDALTRVLSLALSRRAVPLLSGSLLATSWLGARPSNARKKKKKKKATLCLDGQTIQASKKKKKKLLKRGATPGTCSPPPPPPPICTPSCPGTACGTDDGCGGICGCAAGSVCYAGTCQPCTVPCAGNSVDCGIALTAALIDGGTIYLCPGRYTGSYTLDVDTTLIGAGQGSDPATDTILDANGTGRVLEIAHGVTAALHGLRVTGGKSGGGNGAGGILNQGRLTIDDCAITDNSALSFAGGGILHAFNATGPLKISNSTVVNNDAPTGGGLYVHNAAHAVTISNCVISGNRCASANGDGGGIYSVGNPVFILGSAITGNSTSDLGGGIYNASATMTFDSVSSVTGNSAANGGGGIYNDDGLVNLNAAGVSGNTGGNCAGAPAVAGCVG